MVADMMRRATSANIVPRATACLITAMTGAIAAMIPIIAATIAAMIGETVTSGAIRSAGCIIITAAVTGAASRDAAG